MTRDAGRQSLRTGTIWMVIMISSISLKSTDGRVYFSMEELSGLFGPNGCVEGTLTMPSTHVEVQTTPTGFDQTTTTTESVIDVNEINANESSDLNSNLSNKEKTPMCLVNELARYNKILHQYRLTNEQGPPHRKQFTVTLKLGDEEYTAEGASIKKAQHHAANIALSQTKYKHPPPKPLRSIRLGKNNITPTVELNAWAMKRGELATYHFIAPSNPPVVHPIGPACPTLATGVNFIQQVAPPYTNFTGYNGFRPAFGQIRGQHGADFHRRNMYRPHYPQYEPQRYYSRGPTQMSGIPAMFAIMVRVGSREFTGEGPTAQLARHAAAAKALAEIRQLPLPDDKSCVILANNGTTSSKEESEIKSPISLVHEVALRRNLNVKFEVVKVTGPPHMRNFHTICQVGEFITEGIGNGKKTSKRRASEKMMDELRKKLPPDSPCNNMSTAASVSRAKRKAAPKKKSRNLIKEARPTTPTENVAPPDKEEINPISRLIQIQQAKKEPEPLYTLIEEKGAPRRREFIMSVKVGNQLSTGTGPNKKVAKRAAAENMLVELGYSRSSVKDSSKKVSDTTSVGGSSGRQLVPGLLLMSDPTYSPPIKGSVMPEATTSMAKELLDSSDPQGSQNSPVVRPKDQLQYLAGLMNFKVQFSDFPKGNHREFLSLVSLSTSPPQVCHGAGQSVDASHDQAALTALRMLAEMGLDMFTSSKKDSSSPPPESAGLDGLELTTTVFNAGSTNQIYEDPKQS